MRNTDLLPAQSTVPKEQDHAPLDAYLIVQREPRSFDLGHLFSPITPRTNYRVELLQTMSDMEMNANDRFTVHIPSAFASVDSLCSYAAMETVNDTTFLMRSTVAQNKVKETSRKGANNKDTKDDMKKHCQTQASDKYLSRRMLTVRESFRKLLQLKDKAGAAVGLAPAAAEDKTVVAKEGDWEIHFWIPLETWLCNAANSREWPEPDTTDAGYLTWSGMLQLFAKGYVAIQQERHLRDLWCDKLEAKDLLVSGTLDFTLPRNEIRVAKTLKLSLLGSWRWVHPEDQVELDYFSKYCDLGEFVEELLEKHFPQYADLWD